MSGYTCDICGWTCPDTPCGLRMEAHANMHAAMEYTGYVVVRKDALLAPSERERAVIEAARIVADMASVGTRLEFGGAMNRLRARLHDLDTAQPDAQEAK